MSELEAGDPWVLGRDLDEQWIHDSQYGHLHLRDFFAAFALAGLATTLLEADATAAGRIAYTFADAALRAREIPNGSKKPE